MGVCVALGTGELVCLGNFWDYVLTGETEYVGVELGLANGTHYGYVEVKGNFGFGTLLSFAWETQAGVPIVAGSVPEAGRTLTLTGVGVWLALLRRRRAFGAG